MKKIKLLAVAFVSFVAVTSCSKDTAAAASLEGKWEPSKEGTVINGQEVLTDHAHTTGCTKDYSMITTNSIIDHSFSGSNCAESTYISSYTKNGNMITASSGGFSAIFEIKTLDSTTLKIYYTDNSASPPETSVSVLKRVN